MTSSNLLLLRLAELMLQYEKTILPVDLLFDDEQIGDFVTSIQIDSPYQQILLEGVLTETVRDEKLYVSFTVEAYFHYVLGQLLFKNSMNNRFEYLLKLLKFNKLNGLQDALAQCLIDCAKIRDYSPIINFIDIGKTNICIIPLITAFNIYEVNEILDEIIQNESDQDYAIIGEVLILLKANGRINLVEKIHKYLLNLFGVVNINDSYFYRQKLKLQLLNSLEDIVFIELIENICKNNKNYFYTFSEEQKMHLLFELNTSIVERGLLKLAYRFATKFQLYNTDIKSITANYYNLIYPLLELGLFEEAEKCYKKCEPYNSSNAIFINWSGFIYQSWYELKSGDINHIEKGLGLYLYSSKLLDEEYGKYSIQKYQNLENIGYTFSLLKDYEKAITIFNQAIDILIKIYRSNIVYSLGNLYEMLATTFNQVGRYQEAIELTFLSDQCKLQQVAVDSPEMAWNHYDRSKIYMNLGDRENAIESMNLAYKIRKQSLGEDNIITTQTRIELNQLIHNP
jgi:tetratricopeptide (TPR) repeat protein